MTRRKTIANNATPSNSSATELHNVLGELRQEGAVDSQGSFTLDPVKAREKLRKYRFKDPYHYVLALISAGILLRADRIECYNDADDLIVEFNSPLTSSELHNLFADILNPHGYESPRARALHHLAIGLNAALNLNPSSVVLETMSPSAEEAYRYVVDDSLRNITAVMPQKATVKAGHTRIHVKEKFTWRIIQKFFMKFKGIPPEGQAIASLCRYSPIPIILNQQDIRSPINAHSAPVWLTLRSEDDLLRLPEPEGDPILHFQHNATFPGTAAFLCLEQRLAPQATFILAGVEVLTKHPDFRYYPARAIIRWDAMQLDISGTGAIEDKAYRNLLKDLRRHLKHLILDLATAWPKFDSDLQQQTKPILLKAMEYSIKAQDYTPRWKEYKSTLIDLPLFRDLYNRPISLRPFLEAYPQTNGLLYLRTPYYDLEALPEEDPHFEELPLHYPIMYLPDNCPEYYPLTKIFQVLIPGGKAIDEALYILSRRNAWEAKSPQPATLPSGKFLVRLKLKSLEGEIALPAYETDHYALTLLKKHRLLHILKGQDHAILPLGILAIVNHDRLVPTPDWDGVQECQALREVYSAIRQACPDLFELLSHSDLTAEQEIYAKYYLLQYLRHLYQSSSPSDNLSLPSHLLNCKLLKILRADGTLEWISIAELNHLDQIYWSRPDQLDILRRLKVGYDVLLSPDWLKTLLAKTTEKPILDAQILIQKHHKMLEFLEHPPCHPTLPDELLLKVPIDVENKFHGEIGIGGDDPENLHVTVLFHSRHLTDRTIPLGFGPVTAVVDSTQWQADAEYKDLEANGLWQECVNRLKYLAEHLSIAVYDHHLHTTAQGKEFIIKHFLHAVRYSSHSDYQDIIETLKQIPLFQSWGDPKPLSLNRILQLPKPIDYLLSPSTPPENLSLDNVLLLLSSDERKLISAFLPPTDLEHAQAKLDKLASRREYEQRPVVQKLTLPPGDYFHQATLPAPIEGVIGLLPSTSQPGKILFLVQRKVITQHKINTPIAFEAVVNYDRLELSPYYNDVSKNQAYHEVLSVLEETVAQKTLDFITHLTPDHLPTYRFFLLELGLILHKSTIKRPSYDKLKHRLWTYPLLPTTRGNTISLRKLADHKTQHRALAYLPAQDLPAQDSEAPHAQSILHDLPELPILTKQEQILFSQQPTFRPLLSYSPQLEELAQAYKNRNRPRLKHLSLDESFPNVTWLTRYRFEDQNLKGELGIPLHPVHPPQVILTVDRLPMETITLFPSTEIIGVIEGPFPVSRTWDSLQDPGSIRKNPQIRQLELKVLQVLVDEFPPPTAREFNRAREVLLSWPGWSSSQIKHQIITAKPGSFLNVASSLKLFPLPGGRFADLKILFKTVDKQGKILLCEQNFPATQEGLPIFLALPQEDKIYKFYQTISGDRIEVLQEVSVTPQFQVTSEYRDRLSDTKPASLSPLTPHPTTPSTSQITPQPRESQSQDTMSPTLQPTSSFPPVVNQETSDPKTSLKNALLAELALLGLEESQPTAWKIINQLQVKELPIKTVSYMESPVSPLILNAAHPLVKTLLTRHQLLTTEEVYLLLSSLYSVINRARKDIEDHHERWFHRKLLTNLLGGKPVRK